MNQKERQTVLIRAEAIHLFDRLVHGKVSDMLTLKFGGVDVQVFPPDAMSWQNRQQKAWHEKVAQMVFIPLLEQGLDRYKEEVQKVAETGEVPLS